MPTYSRSVENMDIANQLIEMDLPNTPENVQTASTILQYGLELSEGFMQQVTQQVKGNPKQGALDGAVVSLLKGVGDDAKAVDVMAGHLTKNPQLAAQMAKMQASLAQLGGQLQGSPMFEAGLTAGLTSVFDKFSEEFRRMTRKKEDGNVALGKLSRQQSVSDFSTLIQLLSSLQNKMRAEGRVESREGKAVDDQIEEAKQSAKNVLDHLTAQSILSNDAIRSPSRNSEKYVYYLLHNPFTERPSEIKLLVRKDQGPKENRVNPKKTRIILSFETDELGEVSIIIDVLENKVWYQFHSESEATKRFIFQMQADLKDRMGQLNYELSGVRMLPKRVDIQKYLTPKVQLEDVRRVSTQA